MADIGTLLLKVDADTKQFEAGMKKSNKLIGGLKTATMAASGAILAGTVALGGMAKKATENADRVDKLSQRLGLSRKGFQEWEFVLSQAGTSIDSMQMGMKTLSQKMNDSVVAGSKSEKAFKKLGIQVKKDIILMI